MLFALFWAKIARFILASILCLTFSHISEAFAASHPVATSDLRQQSFNALPKVLQDLLVQHEYRGTWQPLTSNAQVNQLDVIAAITTFTVDYRNSDDMYSWWRQALTNQLAIDVRIINQAGGNWQNNPFQPNDYDIPLLSLEAQQINYYNSLPAPVPVPPGSPTAVGNPLDYATASAAIGTTIVLAGYIFAGAGLLAALPEAAAAGAVIGVGAYVLARLTKAPANEFVSSVSDATGGALVVTAGLNPALQLLPQPARSVVTSGLNTLTPRIRAFGKIVLGPEQVVLSSVLGTLIGSIQYVSHTRTHRDITGVPGQSTGTQPFYSDGYYNICTSFQGGSYTCWKHYY